MSMTIKEAIEAKKSGFVIKNSVFLPFHLEILYLWVGKEMSLLSKPDVITDLSGKGEVMIRKGETYTNLVFLKHEELRREYGKYKGHVILFCTEKGDDIFDVKLRHYVKLSFHDDSDEVFLELIDNPAEL